MSTSHRPDARQYLLGARVLPVVTVREVGASVALAHELARAGLRAIEITLRSPEALAAVRAIRSEVPALSVAVGTVLDARQIEAAIAAGAAAIVTPGATDALLAALEGIGIPAIPGIATASELMRALEHGFGACKFFPAEAMGGLAAVRGFAGPFPQAGLCPTGGIAADAVERYLAQPNVLCVGGSWFDDGSSPQAIARRGETLRELSRIAAGP